MISDIHNKVTSDLHSEYLQTFWPILTLTSSMPAAPQRPNPVYGVIQ